MVFVTYYNYLAKGYEELHSKEQISKLKVILNELDISNKKVLDIGCGTAFYSEFFKNYTGIDNSREMLKMSDANVLFGKAENLPFKDKCFDVAISLSAVHNFEDYRKAIDEMNRVAKDIVIISLFKRAKKFDEIKNYFMANKEIDEDKDLILFKFLKR